MQDKTIATKVGEQRKLDFIAVEKEFFLRGLLLLSSKDDYDNNRSKLGFICSMHSDYGIQEIDWNHFKQRKQGCKICGIEKRKQSIKLQRMDFNVIRKAFEERKYILLSGQNEYENNETKLRYQCTNHPETTHEITWGHFNSGKRCKYCANDNFTGENNPNWKGGISSITYSLRISSTQEWRKKSLERYNYTCDVSVEPFEEGDEVHHIHKSYSEIVYKMLRILGLDIRQSIDDYSQQEKNEMKKIIIKLHEKYGEGVPMKKCIHDLYHKIYGKGNPNIKDYEDFKLRYGNVGFSEYKWER